MAKKQNKKTTATRATPRKQKQHKGPSILRRVVLALILAGLGVLGALGWQRMTTLRCQRIVLVGLHHADSTALMKLAQVDTGMVLIDIDPAIVADRVRRHPWVRTARATRYPTGTLWIAVKERTPAVLVMDVKGRPAHYLDRAGYAMPLASRAVYDVPLLYGLREPYHPIRRLQQEQVRALLEVIATRDDETDALVSELWVSASSEVQLRTTPIGTHGSLQVRLGREDFAEKLKRLHAFWHQAVLPQPDKIFHVIDLRFDGQIVTREAGE